MPGPMVAAGVERSDRSNPHIKGRRTSEDLDGVSPRYRHHFFSFSYLLILPFVVPLTVFDTIGIKQDKRVAQFVLFGECQVSVTPTLLWP
jgi:hypothetical protein